MRERLASLKNRARQLISRHGAEVGAVAKIAANALIPGAPMIVGAVEAVCDYSAEKGQALTDERMMELMEALGGDVDQLESLLGHMAGQLDGLIGQVAQMAQFGTPPQALEAMINTALESQFSDLRAELRAITPELETVKRQGEEMLRQQALQGDMLSQVQDQLSAALAFNAPLAGEGVMGAQMSVFLGARGRFQSALLSGDLEGAQSALDQMRGLSPNGNTYRVSAMALRAALRDFAGAEQEARAIRGAGADDPRLQRARQSLTRLTRGGGRSSSAGADQARSTRFTPTELFTPTVIEPGGLIGDKGWKLEALIGRGGMGEVWKVTNLRGKPGALKLMSASLTDQPDFIERFRAEIDALEEVKHPSVVGVRDWGRAAGVGWYFVMPFIEGESLRARLRRGSLQAYEVERIVLSLAEGLAACHAKGVVHRDLKPENILLRADGTPVLIDFGIAHQEGVSSGDTRMATGGYAPPEQQLGRSASASVDLYALGVVWVECYGGWERVPEEWSEVLERLTHNHPSRRGEVDELIKFLKGASGRRAQERQQEREHEEVSRREADRLRVKAQRQAEERQQRKRESVLRDAPPIGHPNPSKDYERSHTYKKTEGALFWKKSADAVANFKMIYLGAGEFWMGEKGARHRVAITRPFWIGQTQVTQALWEAIMGGNPSRFKGATLPVEQVSWFDCVRFCNALSIAEGLEPVYSIGSGNKLTVSLDLGRTGYRLPTEAEWEYAAKAGAELTYAGSNDVDEVAWYRSNSGSKIHPVAQKKPNDWGLYDCSGNVWEWCSDQWSDSAYQGRTGTTRDPHEWVGSASPRVRRGGDWSGDADYCRVAYRGRGGAVHRWSYLGFRVLRCEP